MSVIWSFLPSNFMPWYPLISCCLQTHCHPCWFSHILNKLLLFRASVSSLTLECSSPRYSGGSLLCFFLDSCHLNREVFTYSIQIGIVFPCHAVIFFLFYFLCFNYSLHSTLFRINFRWIAQQIDIHIGYKVFPLIIQVPTWHHT